MSIERIEVGKDGLTPGPYLSEERHCVGLAATMLDAIADVLWQRPESALDEPLEVTGTSIVTLEEGEPDRLAEIDQLLPLEEPAHGDYW